jgi:hypothetical protein
MLQEKLEGDHFYKCHLGDSVEFIKSYSGPKINIAYLDSFDLYPEQFYESEIHGLEEFKALTSQLQKGYSFILIDDTPRTFEIYSKIAGVDIIEAAKNFHTKTGRIPGKGSLIANYINNDSRFDILAWEYQLLIGCNS